MKSKAKFPKANAPVAHIVVDVLYDFIVGSLACVHAREAIDTIVTHINAKPQEPVFYVCDAHPALHCSFVEQGGLWPAHCVKGTSGQAIDAAFYNRVQMPEHRPCSENMYEKAFSPDADAYSGYEAQNAQGRYLHQALEPGQTVLVSGIATEYCVFETAKDFLKAGFKVQVLQEGLAYISPEGHQETLMQMEFLGIELV